MKQDLEALVADAMRIEGIVREALGFLERDNAHFAGLALRLGEEHVRQFVDRYQAALRSVGNDVPGTTKPPDSVSAEAALGPPAVGELPALSGRHEGSPAGQAGMATARVGFRVPWRMSWPGVGHGCELIHGTPRDGENVMILKDDRLPSDHPIVRTHPENFELGT
jgi:hypothetical protein